MFACRGGSLSTVTRNPTKATRSASMSPRALIRLPCGRATVSFPSVQTCSSDKPMIRETEVSRSLFGRNPLGLTRVVLKCERCMRNLVSCSDSPTSGLSPGGQLLLV